MKNQIKILGAYGTKAKGYGTSAFYLNEKNMIDAGNLLSTLEEQCGYIENIWLTHSHLDHICDIAYILDNYYSQREKSLVIHGLPETITALQEDFLNNRIWPDFSKIMLSDQKTPCIEYKVIEFGTVYTLEDGTTIEAYPTDHTVASCGYIYTKNKRAILITADTYSLETTFEIIERNKSIKAMVIECSFPSSMDKLALESKHLTPKILFESLDGLKREDIRLYINHIKPLYLEEIIKEIKQLGALWSPIILKDKEIIFF